MRTNSNPQEPVSTTAEVTKTAAFESDATVQATPSESAEPKAKPTEKPAAKKPVGRRPAAKRESNSNQKAKTAGAAPTVASAVAKKGPREGSTMWAILQVLGSATEPLSGKAIYAEIAERKLAPGLKGKTPDQSVAARLAVAAKRREYVEHAAPGKFQLLKERS